MEDIKASTRDGDLDQELSEQQVRQTVVGLPIGLPSHRLSCAQGPGACAGVPGVAQYTFWRSVDPKGLAREIHSAAE